MQNWSYEILSSMLKLALTFTDNTYCAEALGAKNYVFPYCVWAVRIYIKTQRVRIQSKAFVPSSVKILNVILKLKRNLSILLHCVAKIILYYTVQKFWFVRFSFLLKRCILLFDI